MFLYARFTRSLHWLKPLPTALLIQLDVMQCLTKQWPNMYPVFPGSHYTSQIIIIIVNEPLYCDTTGKPAHIIQIITTWARCPTETEKWPQGDTSLCAKIAVSKYVEVLQHATSTSVVETSIQPTVLSVKLHYLHN